MHWCRNAAFFFSIMVYLFIMVLWPCFCWWSLSFIFYLENSEFEDASQDRQRSTGGLSMHSFSRRNEYSSSPPTKGDSFSRGIHGKWETRSSGRSDKDSDSQSELDSGFYTWSARICLSLILYKLNCLDWYGILPYIYDLVMGIEVEVSLKRVIFIYFIVCVYLQILENVLAINRVDLGKVLSMMGFLVVVLFLGPLGIPLGWLPWNFELMTTTS